jgi:energy-coupling factor transporter transmembrane protein EcfT
VIDASIGICLFIAGMISGFVFVPWRYPTIRYWKLMIPGYLVFFFSIFWVYQKKLSRCVSILHSAIENSLKPYFVA